MYWLHHWASIWRLGEILEDIFLAFTCQWFIIENKDLIANCWLNWQRGKQDRQTHSPEGTVVATNLGTNNIHVLSQWNNPGTLMLPICHDFWTWHHVCSFYKNSNMKALFLDFIADDYIHQGTRNTSIQCGAGLFSMWYIISIQIRLSVLCCKMWTS